MKTSLNLPEELHTEFEVAVIRIRPRIDKSKVFGLLVEELLRGDFRRDTSLNNFASAEVHEDRRRPQTFYMSEELHTEFHVVAKRMRLSMSHIGELLINRFLRNESSVLKVPVARHATTEGDYLKNEGESGTSGI